LKSPGLQLFNSQLFIFNFILLKSDIHALTHTGRSCYSTGVGRHNQFEEALSMTNLRDTMIMSRTNAIIRIRMMAMITLAVGVSPG
jgi:hypothetical protein